MAPLNLTYGAVLIGVIIAAFFQGVLTLQVFTYYSNYPEDYTVFKILVGHRSLLLYCGTLIFNLLAAQPTDLMRRSLDLTHLVLISQATFHYLIINFDNYAALAITTPEFQLHLVFVALPTLLCQVFFLYRIWIFSNHNFPVVVFLVLGCLAVSALDIAIASEVLIYPMFKTASGHYPTIPAQSLATFALGAVVDVGVALTMVYYLYLSKTQFTSTNSIITRVMHFTVVTGLATSLLAVGCIIAYVAAPGTFVFMTLILHFKTLHFSLGRAYTNAVLASLNSRRHAGGTSNQRSSHSNSRFRSFSQTGSATLDAPQTLVMTNTKVMSCDHRDEFSMVK
ncbi:hypothetical protein K438DRAFT_1771306 [Mycena galopus ATCC 62051]|nr:hypothetical protein K438DRAFT_1771306 [Mycena galopus ATCC 62051]